MPSKNTKKLLVATSAAVAGAFAVMGIIAKKKRPESVYDDQPEEKNPLEGKKVVFVPDENDKENADGVKGHLEAVGDSEYKGSFYDKYGKRALDVFLSGMGLIVLSPVFVGITLAIKIDDPGPALFTQKRVGKNKQYFKLHKFRSMKMSTPHDVPTHMLDNPDQYITRTGRFIRRHSLDEIAQLWDIFIGNMSVIGPRPALWNQDVLTAERDKYGANDIKPGLTGWAQINGRDELEIVDKAKLDGEYVKNEGPAMDLKCFLGSLGVFGGDSSVVEGGTGEIHKENKLRPGVPETDPEPDFGFKKKFVIDKEKKIKVLVVGAGSYIGETFASYAAEHYPNITVDTVGTLNGEWREVDFSAYDTIYDVAGIAHADVGNVSDEVKEKYYAVNTDLTLEIAYKAKEAAEKSAEECRPLQFIFMSSAIIYGDSAPYGTSKMIDEDTVPAPANFYGDSKWQADKGVRALSSSTFHVAVLRPPMIYGKGSKGNYPTLAKLAKKLPIFPDVDNERSMLYVGNLCEFLCQLMLSGEGGIYFPQNSTYTKTSEMVKEISVVAGGRIMKSKVLNPAVKIGQKVPGKIGGLVDKAFGNLTYDQKLSRYEGIEYQKNTLKESIEKTEGSILNSKKVLFLVNHDVVIYNFRLELVQRLLTEGYEVHISCPFGDHTEELKNLGAVMHDIDIERHGMNPVTELELANTYYDLIKEVQPSVVLTYTIKPNIYGGIACRRLHVPFIANVTGLGTSVNDGGWKEKLILILYRFGLTGAQKIFFQNRDNLEFMVGNHVVKENYDLLPGSGVNLAKNCFEQYPSEDQPLIFTAIGRIMKDKGTDEFLSAARKIKQIHPEVKFRMIGFYDGDYEEKINSAVEDGTIEYIPQQLDIHPFMAESNAIIHPSYHEGMSNVLLEAAATGRPVLASDIPGCRETFDEGVSGLSFEPKNVESLVNTIEKFIELPYEKKVEMGKAGRAKVEKEFDRQIVVNRYMQEIESIKGAN